MVRGSYMLAVGRVRRLFRGVPLASAAGLVLGLLLVAAPGAFALRLAGEVAQDVRDAWLVHTEGREVRLASPGALQLPLTVASRFTVQAAGGGLERIVLAAMQVPGGDDALALVWAPSPSNWFGTVWSLQLQSPGGIMQGGVPVSLVELATVNPAAGHTYEALVSVDEEGRGLALAVVDRTEGKSLWRGTVELAGLPGELVPAMGVRGSFEEQAQVAAYTGAHAEAEAGAATWPEGAPVAFDRIALAPAWLPVSAQLSVGTPTRSGQIVEVQRFGTDDTIAIGLRGVEPDAFAGAWRLTFADAQGQTRTLDAAALLAGGTLELSTGDLPIGSAQVRLEYAGDGGRALLVAERELAIGSVRFQFTEFVADKARGELQGRVQVTSSDFQGPVAVRVAGLLERLAWDAERREYVPEIRERIVLFEDVVALQPEGVTLSYSTPMPDEPGTWRLRLEPSTEVGAGIDSFGLQERWFSTHPPARIEPGEPFTVAILPDTQLYTYTYPYVFTRQTAWLAEVAAERNIGMVLHLGDVTEQNNRWEWERADQSLGLLDGVIPYAVTVGNHDIIDGSYSVYDRGATLLNEFFPPERFTRLAGTFEPGRVENSYHLVTLGDRDFLFLMLEYAPRDEVLAWAGEVLQAHPDHTAIVVTHTYLAGTGTARVSPYSSSDYPQKSPLAKVPGESVNDGEDIWAKLIRWHPNVLMVWSGHIPTTAIRYRMSAGAAFNPVYELLADFQGEGLGGSGWLVLLEFAPDGTKVTARTYSPYLGTYNTTVDQYGFTNHIIIETGTGRVQRLSD